MPVKLIVVFAAVLDELTTPPPIVVRVAVSCVLEGAAFIALAVDNDVKVKLGAVIAPAFTKLIEVVCDVVPVCKIYKPSTI